MQEIHIYLNAENTAAVVRDSYNAKNVAAPTLTRGVTVELHIHLFDGSNTSDPLPIPDGIESWAWYMDVDFSDATDFKISGDNEHIVTIETDTDTEVIVPLIEMNSEALVEWIGNDREKGGLIGELTGYGGLGDPIFVLQVDGFRVRNQLTGAGEPSENIDQYLTRDEARAMIGTGCHFSLRFL